MNRIFRMLNDVIRVSSRGKNRRRNVMLAALLLSAVVFWYASAPHPSRPSKTTPADDTAFTRSLKTDADATCRGLQDGSLAESAVFRRMYKLKNPLEDAIVVTIPLGNKVGGVVVYTKAGKVYARS